MDLYKSDCIALAVKLRKAVNSFEFQSCGVDSYSVQDWALECMDMEGISEDYFVGEDAYIKITDLTEDTARDLVFFFEYSACLNMLKSGDYLADIFADIDERYCLNDPQTNEVLQRLQTDEGFVDDGLSDDEK